MCTEDASTHAGELLDGELILHFGKHKGRTLLSLQEEDWPYLLWLAGYNFGRMDDRGKAEKRVAANGSNFITNELETEAKNIVQGLCFNCQDDICDFDKQPWRTGMLRTIKIQLMKTGLLHQWNILMICSYPTLQPPIPVHSLL